MKKGLVVLIGMTAMILVACGEGRQSNIAETPDTIPAAYAGKTNPLGADSITPGAETYKSYCASCHGVSGHGDGPAGAALDPSPKNLAELQTQVGDDYLFWRINEGKEGTSMAAWKDTLTEEQIWQLVSFLHMLK